MRIPFAKLGVVLAFVLMSCIFLGFLPTLGIILLIFLGWSSSMWLNDLQEREQQREANRSEQDSRNNSANSG